MSEWGKPLLHYPYSLPYSSLVALGKGWWLFPCRITLTQNPGGRQPEPVALLGLTLGFHLVVIGDAFHLLLQRLLNPDIVGVFRVAGKLADPFEDA